jgi:hypothetical protein
VIRLRRRGVDHGRFVPAEPAQPVDAAGEWDRAAALHLPGGLGAGARWTGAIRRTSSLFTRLLAEADFEADVWRRLAGRRGWEPAGVSVDLGDPREIVKVHVDRRGGGRFVARDLWAKLSWISPDPRDASLRIRFSFGSELHDDWRGDLRRAVAADDLAEAVFPECARITRNAPLARLMRRLIGRRVRLSERIVFANAPGGGARFHHDAEPGQLGVVYGQMAGRTAWLAIPKRELAGVVAGLASGSLARRAGTPGRALRALDREDEAMARLLNSTPTLTRHLAGRGDLTVLRPGDVLLLPSHEPDAAAWHSVFALGDRPSLAHSYGIFAAR